MKRSLTLAALTLALLAGCASSMRVPARMNDGMLVNSDGMTLYIFDRDMAASGKSVCNGACASDWPPYMATGSVTVTGDFTVITRDDGGKQWAWRGRPLYLFPQDTDAGDKFGDGVGGNWHIVTP